MRDEIYDVIVAKAMEMILNHLIRINDFLGLNGHTPKMKIVVDEGADKPVRGHETDAGLDLRSTIDVWVHPHEHTMIPTGVHVEIPKGCVGLLTSKSGLMARGLTSRGTIDSGYTGEVKCILFNHSDDAYCVHKGDKVTQLVILPCIIPDLDFVESLEETDRGEKGFGSTGV